MLKKIKNKKGSALMQVLLISIILITLTTGIMNLTMTRETNAIKIRKNAVSVNILQGCRSQLQAQWLMIGFNNLDDANASNPLVPDTSKEYKCTIEDVEVTAKITNKGNGQYGIVYTIDDDSSF